MDKRSYVGHVIRGGKVEASDDLLAGEGPLHILVNGESYVTTMRTPDDHDIDLSRGLLFTEGIVTDPAAVFRFDGIADPEANVVAKLDVLVSSEYVRVSVEGRRSQTATASCGICGTRDPSDLELSGEPLKISGDFKLSAQTITGMLADTLGAQALFHATGGVHGAGAYTRDGDLLVVREDIGRHNAVDKVIGALLRSKRLGEATVLTVSGRLSYEIVSKVYRAQIPVLVAVSAPSTMAVETARSFGITLIAFCREDRMTVYSHPERITV
jgi:FdhD protein